MGRMPNLLNPFMVGSVKVLNEVPHPIFELDAICGSACFSRTELTAPSSVASLHTQVASLFFTWHIAPKKEFINIRG